MKKNILSIGAAIAALFIFSTTSFAEENTTSGKIVFTSTAVPALNCTMPVSTASIIFRMMPESIVKLCKKEYKAVRKKIEKSSNFKHEGVNVKITNNNGSTATVLFSAQGYQLCASDVSWSELDKLFDAE